MNATMTNGLHNLGHTIARAFRPVGMVLAVLATAAIQPAALSAQDNAGSDAISELSRGAGRNHAVLIAVQEFEYSATYPNLSNTVNDMNALGDVLEKRYGFEVTRLFNKDATLNKVVTEIREKLPSRVKEGDSVLIAFATHGKYSENDKEGYLILQDTENYKTGISLGNLNQYTKNQQMERARAILFMLDACEMGKVETVEFRSVNVKPEVVMRKFRSIVTSAGYVKAADASPTNPLHSPFAEALIEQLDRDNKPKQMFDLMLDVSKAVKDRTSGNQMPKQRKLPSDQDGDFVFQQASAAVAGEGLKDGYEIMREQIALAMRQVSAGDDAEVRRRASFLLIANKPMFDSLPADLQRDYVQLMTVAINPAAPEWKAEQAWVEQLLPRGGEMGKVKLAQLYLATGRREAGIGLLDEVARPVATRSTGGANPSLRASAAAALLQLGVIKYEEWRANKEFTANARAAVERFNRASALAGEAGQSWVQGGIQLRAGHVLEEATRYSITAPNRRKDAGAQVKELGTGALKAYAGAGARGRSRLLAMRTYLQQENQRLGKSSKAEDKDLAQTILELIDAAIAEENRL